MKSKPAVRFDHKTHLHGMLAYALTDCYQILYWQIEKIIYILYFEN